MLNNHLNFRGTSLYLGGSLHSQFRMAALKGYSIACNSLLVMIPCHLLVIQLVIASQP